MKKSKDVMMNSGFVNRALVIPIREGHYIQLISYVVLTAGYDREKLIDFMRRQLPDYMLPVQIIPIENVPLTPNGKVDKKALSMYKPHTTPSYVPPRTRIEEKLVHIWEELLNHSPIGIHDNFFELGGHSLHITSLSYAVFNQFGVKIILLQRE